MDADLKSIRVRRKSGQTMALNLYQAIIKGDDSQDIVLDNGDLIYLPSLSKDGNRVYVFVCAFFSSGHESGGTDSPGDGDSHRV